MSHLFITTAIDYANAKPHLGHAYEKVLTDTLARFARRQGLGVRFLSGLDEHGQKVQQSAAKNGQSPQQFVDGISGEFLRLWKILKVEPDDYLRTTEPRHRQVVQAALQQLHQQGDIVRGTFKGFYSIRAEQFLTEKERQPDGSWPEIYGEVVELTEENYFFQTFQVSGLAQTTAGGQSCLGLSGISVAGGFRGVGEAVAGSLYFPTQGPIGMGNPPAV